MQKLLLIDGSNLLFQMFFGMPARIVNRDGKAIQGTLGFVGAMLKIIRMVKPSHIAVIFDGAHHNDRTDVNAEYKANRPDFSDVSDDMNPYSQLEDIYRAIDYLGIRRYETEMCETDDVISQYVVSYSDRCDIVISSFDSDFFQLASDSVSVLRYRGEKTIICDPEYVKEKFGVEPSLYADWKSLVGDKADNIRGADKVGPKTAAELINEFGSFEEVLNNADSIRKRTARESIQSDRDRLISNYEIIRLSGCCEMPFEMSELEFLDRGCTTNDVLKGIGLR